jgi:dimethylhistidine N-methyltransferase
VLEGLSLRQKAIPSKYFYDRRGSELFECICALPEYYPTRTEIALLRTHGPAIADAVGPDRPVIEFGAGAAVKARLLLAALIRPRAYLPVDISRDQLHQTAAAIARDHDGLEVVAVCADYTRPFPVPWVVAEAPVRPLGFFPGSTIGNFTPAEARHFLSRARQLLKGGLMLVGADLQKPAAVLYAAYNDRAGITAAFNLNLLVRINRELGGDFQLDQFRHRAFYNGRRGRIEMHLESQGVQRVAVAGRRFTFGQGETIHTENSVKYTVESFTGLAAAAGFGVRRLWTDDSRSFGLFLLADAGD